MIKTKTEAKKEEEKENENTDIPQDSCGGSAESSTTSIELDLLRTPSPGYGFCLEWRTPKNWWVVASLRDLPLIGEPDIVPSLNTTRNQAAFTIPLDKQGPEKGEKLPSPTKVECGDDVLTFNSASSSPKTRKCLVPPDTQDSLDNRIPKDLSVVLEPQEKPTDMYEVPDYREDIYLYLRTIEVSYMPKADSMKKHPPISNSERALLVDWLAIVVDESELHNETLHLAVNYVDRFIWSSVFQGKLLLVGAAALFIASKFEEVYPLRVFELMDIREDGHTEKDLLSMEQLMLKVLGFDLAAPTSHQFINQYFLHQQQANSKVESLAMFLVELSLVDANLYLNYVPSVIAGAAFLLALYTITGKSWPESFKQKTGYSLESLKPCLVDLHQTFRAPEQALTFIPEKYRMPRYQAVSLINPPETLDLQ